MGSQNVKRMISILSEENKKIVKDVKFFELVFLLLDKFTYCFKENFPVRECTHEFEKGVFDGENEYLVAVLDTRFSNQLSILKLVPYTFKDEDTGKLTYGWSDKNRVVDNAENAVSGIWDEFAIAFVRIV